MKALSLIGLFCAQVGFAASGLNCHFNYGGDHSVIQVIPASDPYTVPNIKIGRKFAVKVVYIDEGSPLSTLSIYVYGVVTGDPVLISQQKFLPPFPRSTGLHFVYEPETASEIQYWCELS